MTEDSYRIMFQRLVARFGPHYHWRMKTYPKGLKDQYREFQREIAKVLGVSPGSVDNYISWAYTKQKSIPQGKKSDYRPTWLRAKYHAFETGFIDNEYLVPLT